MNLYRYFKPTTFSALALCLAACGGNSAENSGSAGSSGTAGSGTASSGTASSGTASSGNTAGAAGNSGQLPDGGATSGTGGTGGNTGMVDGGASGGSGGSIGQLCEEGTLDCEALPGKKCINGEWIESDACPIAQEPCGNGQIDAPDELCDDGNRITEAACAYGLLECTACNADCTELLQLSGNVCGDGIQDSKNESCDDGNQISEAACAYGDKDCLPCLSSCKRSTASFCGDKKVDTAQGEICDDGNDVDTDSCNNLCQISVAQTPCEVLGLSEGCYDNYGLTDLTVPSGVTQIRLRVWGAGGGDGNQLRARGGGGAYLEGHLNVSVGDSVKLAVGQGGSIAGSGGGASLVYHNNSLILVAAGGGGGASDGNSGNSGVGGRGGAGGISQGQDGEAWDIRFAKGDYVTSISPGLGGTSLAGGLGGIPQGTGTSTVASVCEGGAGSAFQGGAVRAAWGCATPISFAKNYLAGGGGSNGHGGGGGSGYFGGGSGGSIWTYAGSGGGGGSSYFSPSLTQLKTEAGQKDTPGSASHSGGAGFNRNNGLIIVDWI